MIKLHIIRPTDEVEVLLLKNKEDSTFSFVNLTKGHICPCRFKTIEEAFKDLNSYKESGKIISYKVMNKCQICIEDSKFCAGCDYNNKKLTFAEKNLKLRDKTDYVLNKSEAILIMLDGRAFSNFSKQFDLPFDNHFVEMMNETAKYLCANIQNAVYAFVQSDEISIYLKPCDELTEPWFGGRLNKICSVAASMASAFFTSKYISYKMEFKWSDSDGVIDTEVLEHLNSIKVPSFDCRAWNVPTYKEVVDWFVFRQRDCIRNSKQQFSQSYVPHKELLNKTADEQIEYTKKATWGTMDWNNEDPGVKYGRLVRKTIKQVINPVTNQPYNRSVWIVGPAQVGENNISYLL